MFFLLSYPLSGMGNPAGLLIDDIYDGPGRLGEIASFFISDGDVPVWRILTQCVVTGLGGQAAVDRPALWDNRRSYADRGQGEGCYHVVGFQDDRRRNSGFPGKFIKILTQFLPFLDDDERLFAQQVVIKGWILGVRDRTGPFFVAPGLFFRQGQEKFFPEQFFIGQAGMEDGWSTMEKSVRPSRASSSSSRVVPSDSWMWMSG